jgi:hypothetical protein
MPVSPTFLLKAFFDSYSENAFWSENDNTSDPYIGYAYRWDITFNITPQQHSNHTTLTPNYFTGMDIKVGDWFASGINGKAVVIIEIKNQNDFQVEAVVEDYERWNLFTDPNLQGYGLVTQEPGFFFRLNNEGMPILGPIEEFYLPTKTIEDLQARFFARNGLKEFVLVRQELHGFVVGDVIYADFETDYGYKKVNAANFNRAIGIVTEVGVPGLYYFAYRPLGRLINDVNPPLWGAHGDIFYLDPNEPGALTNEKPASNAIPVYLQLDLPNRAIMLERGAEITIPPPPKDSETYKYDVENVTAGQTTFTIPDDALEVLYMAINGIENENFTFDPVSKVLNFDPVETGYGVDVDDEVFFIYKS